MRLRLASVRPVFLTLIISLLANGPVPGQTAAPLHPAEVSGFWETPGSILTPPLAGGGLATEPLVLGLRQRSIQRFSTASRSLAYRLRLPTAAPHNGRRNALVGGLIGGATGVIACTVISNIVNDSGTGFSTCDTMAYVGFGLGGAAIGATIGFVLR